MEKTQYPHMLMASDPRLEIELREPKADEVLSLPKSARLTYAAKAVTLQPYGVTEPLLTAAVYWTETRCYCTFYLYAPGAFRRGAAYVSGYGYHMPSAALEEALRAAGIIVKNLSGTGPQAMVSALHAIANFYAPDGRPNILVEFNA